MPGEGGRPVRQRWGAAGGRVGGRARAAVVWGAESPGPGTREPRGAALGRRGGCRARLACGWAMAAGRGSRLERESRSSLWPAEAGGWLPLAAACRLGAPCCRSWAGQAEGWSSGTGAGRGMAAEEEEEAESREEGGGGGGGAEGVWGGEEEEEEGEAVRARAQEGPGDGSWRLRPYHPERARSRLISEAKQGRAWLVLGWETAWEYRVL